MFKVNDFSSKTYTIPTIFLYSIFCFLNPSSSSYFSILRDYLLDVELVPHLFFLAPLLDGEISPTAIFWFYGQTLDLVSFRPEAEEPTLSNSLFLYHGFCAFFSTYIVLFLARAPSFTFETSDDDDSISEIASFLTLILGSAWSVQEVLWGGVWSWDAIETLLLLSTLLTLGSIHGGRLDGSEDTGPASLTVLFFVLSFYSSQPQFSNSIHAFTTSSNDLIQTPLLCLLVTLPFWPTVLEFLQSESVDRKGQWLPLGFIALCLSFALGLELGSWIPELLILVLLYTYVYRASFPPLLDARLFLLPFKLRVRKVGLYAHVLVIFIIFNLLSFLVQPYGQPINNHLSGFDLTANNIDLFWTAEDGCLGLSNTAMELGLYHDSIFDVVRFFPLVHGGYVSVWLLNQVSIWPIYFLYPSVFLVLFRAKSRHFPCLIIFFFSTEWEQQLPSLATSSLSLMLSQNIERP